MTIESQQALERMSLTVYRMNRIPTQARLPLVGHWDFPGMRASRGSKPSFTSEFSNARELETKVPTLRPNDLAYCHAVNEWQPGE